MAPWMLYDIKKKSDTKEVFFKCDICDYKSEKEQFLKKHIHTKHEDHACKVCKDKFKSFMVLLKHVTEHHDNEPDEDINLHGEEMAKNDAEREDFKKDKPFVLWQSMLDEFLV